MAGVLTRALPENRALRATGNPRLRTTAGDVFGAAFGGETLGTLALRQARINREDAPATDVDAMTLERSEGVSRSGRTPRDAPERIAPDVLNERYKELGLTFSEPVTAESARLLADAKRAEMIREDVFARSEAGLAGAMAGLAGGLLGMAVDPLEVATAFIPVVGPVGRAAMVGRLGRIGGRVAEGAVEGAVGNLLTEPVYGGLSRSQQLDYGLNDALLNTAFGAALGAGLGAGAGVLARMRAGVNVPANRTADAGGPPRIETKAQEAAAARLALSQMATGKTVNIEPSLPPPSRAAGAGPLKRYEGAAPTLIELLAHEGGVQDKGGDLRLIGATEWHRQRGFRRRLVRDDGMSLDEAARVAYDAGYFDQDEIGAAFKRAEANGTEAPDLVPSLLEKINHEMRGDRQFSDMDADAVEAARSAASGEEWEDRKAGTAALLRDMGGDFSKEEVEAVTRMMARGVDVGDAIERVALGDLVGPDGDFSADMSASRAIDERTRRAREDFIAEDEAMMMAMVDELRRAGDLSDEALASVLEADGLMVKAEAAGEVARAYAMCLAR